jgi:alkaline phosphatase D
MGYSRQVIRRRAFLGSLLALGAAPALIQAQPRLRGDPFTLGVASGYPHPGGFVLWTRLMGDLDPVAIPVRWEVAADEAMRSVVASGTAQASPAWGHSVHVELKGLEPERWYWYRFRAGDAASPVGRTRTAPALTATAPRLRFAFASCQHYEHGYYTAYQHMLTDELDLVVFLGDYIYESSVRQDFVRRHSQIAEPVTLADYRVRHALYKSDPDLQAAHRMYPWVVTWDDHEVDNDYANDRQEEGTPPDEFLLRRAAAYQAYYEHMPLPDAMRPRGPHMRIHTGLAWGSLASFHLLDGRQHRSHQACPSANGRSNDVDPGLCGQLRDPARTLLGKEQESWLDERFAGSKSAWNIIAQPLLMAQRDNKLGEGKLFWTDGWDGYPAARRRLLESMVARRVSNPVVIGGDVHMHYVTDLKLDFDDEKSPVVASEFTGTSISSRAGQWARRWKELRDENPHLKYVRGDQRGYVRANVGAGRFHADLVGVETVRKTESRAEVLERFLVENGRPGPRRA